MYCNYCSVRNSLVLLYCDYSIVTDDSWATGQAAISWQVSVEQLAAAAGRLAGPLLARAVHHHHHHHTKRSLHQPVGLEHKKRKGSWKHLHFVERVSFPFWNNF